MSFSAWELVCSDSVRWGYGFTAIMSPDVASNLPRKREKSLQNQNFMHSVQCVQQVVNHTGTQSPMSQVQQHGMPKSAVAERRFPSVPQSHPATAGFPSPNPLW